MELAQRCIADDTAHSVTLGLVSGDCAHTLWSSGTVEPLRDGRLEAQLAPNRPLVIGRQNGGETPYLDPHYQPTTMAPGSSRSVLNGSTNDNSVSRGHFMLKSSPEGVILVNGVPQRGGGIRAPSYGTWLVDPESRRMEQGEEYLISRGTSVKICLPNANVILISAS